MQHHSLTSPFILPPPLLLLGVCTCRDDCDVFLPTLIWIEPERRTSHFTYRSALTCPENPTLSVIELT